MVQVFDFTPREGPAYKIGQALGTGISKNFPKPEQMVQRGMLQQAFNKLQKAPGGDYLSQLSSIAPMLLTTPGGAEALGELAPILAKRAQAEAQKQVIQDRNVVQQTKEEPNVPYPRAVEKIGEEKPYLTTKEKPFPGEEPIYPEPTAGPQPRQVLSPQEVQNLAFDYMKKSSKLGQPMTYDQALNLAQKENENINSYNQNVLRDQELRRKNIEELNRDVVERAVNSNLIQSGDDEARTVAEKLGYEGRKFNNPAERWEFVRTGLRNFNTARENIKREASLPGPFQGIYRKMTGTYKDANTVIKNLQPYLKVYKDLGLYDEARSLLTGELGFGPEQTEMAIFPFSKDQNKDISIFNENPQKPGKYVPGVEAPFPGNQFNLNEKGFQKFKEDIAIFLGKYKDVNLIGMRGILNQYKRYSWQDISKAINELIEEKRFTPNYQQNVQLGVVNNSPLPGMGSIFKEWWKGRK